MLRLPFSKFARQQLLKMPVTRSASGALPNKVVPEPAVVQKKAPAKRKATNAATKAPRKKARSDSDESAGGSTIKLKDNIDSAANTAQAPSLIPAGDPPVLVPAVLTFSFEDAKQHLIKTDRRFQDLFERLKCRPFEHLERLDPFRTLAHSILGQQISWKAARSITHRFIRLFDPSLPEAPDDDHKVDFFPTAHQVTNVDVTVLRSAGLSGRKAEYVKDLAARFADGRLSTQKLLEADDEELANMLIEVRGIGRWTVDMFAIFSLRRPDILPVGDIGVQRGVVRWFLSLHSPAYPIIISPEKLPKAQDEDAEAVNGSTSNAKDEESLPVYGESKDSQIPRALTPDASSVMPAPPIPAKGKAKGKEKSKAAFSHSDPGPEGEGSGRILPAPFTPSINQTLNMHARIGGADDELPVAGARLPDGLSVAALKSRLDGKKKIKGAFLTPQEMEDLTASWRPYRSLAVYYMWALAEPSK